MDSAGIAEGSQLRQKTLDSIGWKLLPSQKIQPQSTLGDESNEGVTESPPFSSGSNSSGRGNEDNTNKKDEDDIVEEPPQKKKI